MCVIREPTRGAPVKTIVVGVNQSPTSAHALRWSASLANFVHARVVAVLAVSRIGIWELAAAQVNPDPVVRGYEESLRGSWTKPLRDAGVEYETRLERGSAADALLRVASDEDADAIVVGARRHHVGHGDSIHRLLKRTTRPLIVVPDTA
jgi:nucleotide-binding universal stress UspA family protein